MLLTKRTTVKSVLSSPWSQLTFATFLGLQSLIYKLLLCIIRRYRQVSDEDGINPFLAGFLSGLSILMLKDPQTSRLLALYMAVRSIKVWADLKMQEGEYSQEGMDRAILACAFIVSTYFGCMYLLDNSFWPDSSWQAVNWIFGFNN